MTIAWPRQPEGPTQYGSLWLRQLWKWLSRCDVEGCEERPVHMGWCARHTPVDDRTPDEYWGD